MPNVVAMADKGSSTIKHSSYRAPVERQARRSSCDLFPLTSFAKAVRSARLRLPPRPLINPHAKSAFEVDPATWVKETERRTGEREGGEYGEKRGERLQHQTFADQKRGRRQNNMFNRT